MPKKQVASFGVSYTQILNEKGEVDPELEPKLSPEQLKHLYRNMCLAREVDQRMLKMQRQGRMGTFPPNTGQEAAVCGAALAMGDRDWMAGSYRELGARLMRGEPIENVLLYYGGFEEGNMLPAERRVLPTYVVLGSQLPNAVGIAYAMQYQGEEGSAVVAFIGDGATSQGDFHEALNFAGVWNAPVVFVCQNNQWAISHPRAKQTRSQTIAQKAVAYGFDGVQVDGNDPLAVYQAVDAALDRAKGGGGPSLIEAVTYRLMMHTTADDPKKYRSEEEERAAWEREPLIRTRLYLQGKGIWDEAKEAAQQEELKAEVAAAVKRFEEAAAAQVKPDTAFDHLYGTRVPEVEAQRAAFMARLAAREG